MVTYLACFIVCDFAYEEIITKVHKTQFRVYATPTQKDRINYSLQVGANITDYFTTYFDVSVSGCKMGTTNACMYFLRFRTHCPSKT